MTNNRDTGNNRSPQINITSHNQTGGITAHTVNIGKPQRRMDDQLRQTILTKIPRDKAMEFQWAAQDAEVSRFADEIEAFLRTSGYSIVARSAVLSADPMVGLSVDIQEDKTIFSVGHHE